MAGQFLTNTERSRYEQVPSIISEEDLKVHFHLSDTDQALINEQRGIGQRLGFACQLCLIKFMGYLPGDWQTTVPATLLERLSDQLDTNPKDLQQYSVRRNTRSGETRSDHLQHILKYLHFTRWTPMDAVQLESWLLERALEHDKPTLLLDLACEKLVQSRILRPSIGTLERMVVAVRGQAYTETHSRLSGMLDQKLCAELDALLVVQENSTYTKFSQLREEPTGVPANANTPSQIKNSLNKYISLLDIGVDSWDLSMLNPNRRKFLAQKARRSTNQELQRMNDEKRYPILIAFLNQNLIDITDSILDMYSVYLEDVQHKCKRELEDYQQKTVIAKDNAIATLNMAAAMIVDEENISAEELRMHIFERVSKAELTKAVTVIQEILRPTRNNFLSFVDNYYNQLRRFSAYFLRILSFRSSLKDDKFLYAIEIVTDLQSGARKKIPEDAPIDFITPTWARYVFGEDNLLVKRAYEWCVLYNLKDKLSSGDIFVVNSHRYADPEGYLVPKANWSDTKEEVYQQLYISSDPYDRINQKIKEIEELLPLVSDLLIGTDEIRLEDGILVVPRLQAQELPDSVSELESLISARLPLVDLSELLMEVNSWTKFTDHFTSVHDGKIPNESQIKRVYASLLSNACNIPWVDMARSTNMDYYDLLWSIRSYQREDTLKQANNHLVNYHHQEWLTALWG